MPDVLQFIAHNVLGAILGPYNSSWGSSNIFTS